MAVHQHSVTVGRNIDAILNYFLMVKYFILQIFKYKNNFLCQLKNKKQQRPLLHKNS